MKKHISVIITGVLLLTMCSFVGCGLKREIDFNEELKNIESDFTKWYVDQSELYTEEDAKKFLYKTVEVSNDGSYLSYEVYSEHDYSSTPEVNDAVNEMLDIYFNDRVEEGFYLASLLNKELGIPDSVIKKMETTSGKDGKQTYEGDSVSITWQYTAKTKFTLLYERN